MSPVLKRLASRLAPTTQQVLKRLYFARQIRNGTFVTDEPEYARLASWVSAGDWVLDVGANVGHYTAKLSELVGEKGRVFAFEPVGTTFELLAANAMHFRYQNVTLINAAASDTTSLIGMSIEHFDSGLKNYYRAKIITGESDLSVYTLPVDTLSIPRPVSLVKVDVEGHELAALSGMEETLRKFQPTLIVEGDSTDVAEYLGRLGYTFRRETHSPNRVYEISA